MVDNVPFWKSKDLSGMTPDEWESLCDGCARCCVHKLQDEDTGDIFYTNVACQFLDHDTCRCKQYDDRRKEVTDCACLDSCDREHFKWLPPTCAYRLLDEGKDLPAWHPLVTGDPDSTRKAGMTVKDCIPEDQVEHLEDHVIRPPIWTAKGGRL